MPTVSEQELIVWRDEILEEIATLEGRIGPLTAKLSELQEKKRAIERLIAPQATSPHSLLPHSLPPSPVSPNDDGFAGTEGSFAPTQAYWRPILQSLVELGGRAEADSILNLVQKKMAGILKPADFEVLPSGISVRWKNRAQWQRKNMVDQGLLRRDSPRGIWEITEAGRKWLGNATGSRYGS